MAADEMYARSKIPVTLPHHNPTASYWHAIYDASQASSSTYDASRSSSTPIPITTPVDYVIIGSGVTGASVALYLLERRPEARVVMLEARGACGGATGRNGGHTKTASYRAFTRNAAVFGKDEAVRIARLERANVDAVHAFAKAHSHRIKADCRRCRSVDVVYDKRQWDAGMEGVEMMRQCGGEGMDEYEVYSAEEAVKRYHVAPSKKLQGVLEYDAGSVNAYAFTRGMLDIAVEKGMDLRTWTPVTGVHPVKSSSATTSTAGATNGKAHENGDSKSQWEIRTSTGDIIHSHDVIVATNGYTAAILPAFQGSIVPLRGQITAQRPGKNLPYGGCLPTTYSFIYDSGYEYAIPRPAGSLFAGDFVIGGGWGAMSDGGVSDFGVTDDSELNPTLSKYLRECTRDRFFGPRIWGDDQDEGRVRAEWTGIMGNSADGVPFVGQMPDGRGGEQTGLWVCASFDGHGMALSTKCAEGLVMKMVGDDKERRQLEEWFPKSFWVTEERLKVPFAGRRNNVPEV